MTTRIQSSEEILSSILQKLIGIALHFQPGFLHLLASRPGIGKTTLALNLVERALLAGLKCGYCTRDRRAVLMTRLWSCSADHEGSSKPKKMFQRLVRRSLTILSHDLTQGMLFSAMQQDAFDFVVLEDLDAFPLGKRLSKPGILRTIRNVLSCLSSPPVCLVTTGLNRSIERPWPKGEREPVLGDLRGGVRLSRPCPWVLILTVHDAQEEYFAGRTISRRDAWTFVNGTMHAKSMFGFDRQSLRIVEKGRTPGYSGW